MKQMLETIAIEGSHLTKRFGQHTAVNDVTITARSGRTVGVLGPDGAGKTTLFRLLAGVMRPDKGHTSRSGGLGYVPQSFSLYPDLSIDENLDFFGSAYGLRKFDLEESKERLLKFVNLTQFRKRLSGTLSGGMKQRLSIAVSLLHKPDVLLMDEPTNGVDPIARRELWELLRTITSEGTAVVVSTQYLEEGIHCDEIALMNGGRFHAFGPTQRLIDEVQMQVWEVDVNGSDRFCVSSVLEAIEGVRHIRRLGTTVRYMTSDENVQTERVTSALGAIETFGDKVGLEARRVAPDICDVYTIVCSVSE